MNIFPLYDDFRFARNPIEILSRKSKNARRKNTINLQFFLPKISKIISPKGLDCFIYDTATKRETLVDAYWMELCCQIVAINTSLTNANSYTEEIGEWKYIWSIVVD
ncbi:hypothetical protein HZS_1205 [Henneguya salminicola]|nr:hypothetical protein HZS_1205 [Henneguya salminicola]